MTDPLLHTGEMLADRYRIEREIGHGGMATVFLAQDVRHNRQVALKVLRPELAAMIGAERFLKEIEVTANLQHPHILPLHDSGAAEVSAIRRPDDSAGGSGTGDSASAGAPHRRIAELLYYVMPFVEGETLRGRLDREKQLGIEEAVEITRNVAAALDYAHRRGVIHRDIKPENVLLHDGQALVADFGIALAVSQAGGSRLTETGLSLGTPHYMSPEQAMGDRELDARSDIYSLGAMLYEMLAGDPPYTGGTAQAIVAKVITEKAPLVSLVRDTVPPHVAATIHKALAKLPADRFHTAAEFSEALAGRGSAMTLPMPSAAPGTARVGSPRVIAGVALFALLLGAVGGWLGRPVPPAPVIRMQVLTRNVVADGGTAISPDGTTIVFGGSDSTGIGRLYTRRLDELEAFPFPGAEGGFLPDFSPDGSQVAYLRGGQVHRIVIGGSQQAVVTDSASGIGLSWGDDGFIYYYNSTGQLARVPAAGGTPDILLPRDTAQTLSGVLPEVLPGGRGVLFTAFAAAGGTQVAVLDLRSRTRRDLTAGSAARYSPSGHLLYVTADGSLVQAPFDLGRLELTGETETIAADLWSPSLGVADISVSRAGTVVYMAATGSAAQGRVFASVDRSGREQVLPIQAANFDAFDLSPDGRQVATEVIKGTDDGGDILVFDLADSLPTRLTFRGLNRYPMWTPDGRRIAFSQLDSAERDIVWKPADGSGAEQVLLKRPGEQFEVEFSRDGRWMVYREGNANAFAGGLGLHYQLRDGSGEDREFYSVPGRSVVTPALSPDGRWLAYASDESGQMQIYVRPFPRDESGAVWQVSTASATEPLWAPSGRELYYKEAGYLMAAETRSVPTFSIIARRRLFKINEYRSNPWHPRYAVLPGDRGFLMVRSTGSDAPPQMTVVVNWAGALKR